LCVLPKALDPALAATALGHSCRGAPERAQRIAELSMQNLLVVNAEGPEIRVAVVEEGSLAEFFVERKRDRGIVGNIYRGKVTRVLPGMQAAFVDLGSKVERAAFLYVADVLGAGDQSKLFDDSDVESDDAGDEAPEGAASR